MFGKKIIPYGLIAGLTLSVAAGLCTPSESFAAKIKLNKKNPSI